MARHTARKKRNYLIYAASTIDADAYYASRFWCGDPFILIGTAKGRRVLVMSDLELGRARAQSNAHRVLSLSEIAAGAASTSTNPSAMIAQALRVLRIRSVVVPPSFPAGLCDELRGLGLRVQPVRAPFFPERVLKRADEIGEIRRTMRITEEGMQAAVDILRAARVRKGWIYYDRRRLTAEVLRAAINETIFAKGCVPSHTIVAPGKQACDPHDVGSGPIRAHEPIIIDIFPRCERSGYYGDITRTFVKGRASDDVRRMYDAVALAQRNAVRAVRDGARAQDIHTGVQDLFVKRGFSTGRSGGKMHGFFHGTGHGLGLEIHEAPRIARNGDTLKAGMVITVEPGLYYHPTGGVRIEDTIVVTRAGMRNLTRFPKFLEID